MRKLRIVVHLAMNVIAQGQLKIEEAYEMVAAARRVAEQLFPGKGDTFDLIYRPRFQRLINEVYRLQ